MPLPQCNAIHSPAKLAKVAATAAAVSIVVVGGHSIYNISQEEIKNTESAQASEGLPTHIVNGDFEYPSTTLDVLQTYNKYYMHYIPYDAENMRWNVSEDYQNFTLCSRKEFGWISTQEGVIVPDGKNRLNQSVEVQRDCKTGNIWAELCSEQIDTAIYQDIATTPGSVYKWKLDHTSAITSFIDKMSVMIGTPDVQVAQMATRTKSNSNSFSGKTNTPEVGDTNQVGYCSQVIEDCAHVGFVGYTAPSGYGHDEGNDWATYEGVYVVPEGQHITRFSFKQVESYGANSGNHVDNISFSIAHPLRYDTNGGTDTGLPAPVASGNYEGYYQEDTAAPVSDIVPVREGYTFVGWTKTRKEDISSKMALDAVSTELVKDSVKVSAPTTLYALWAKNPTVSYIDPLDDNKIVYSTEIPFGSAAPELTSSNIPVHDNYDFTGYATPLPQEVYEDTIIPLAYKGSAVKLRVQLINAKNGSPLRWAGFKISADAKNDIDTLSLITDPNGCATFNGIAFGDYTAHLEDRPKGFLYPDYIVDFSADPALADKDGYITVEIPVMPQLSRRTSEYESDNTFDFYYPAWIAVYGDDELVMGRGTGYPYASYDGKPLNEEYIWLDVERRELGTRPFWDVKEQITSVKVIDRIRPLNPQMWFLHFSACISYDVTKLDMSACTSLQMFFGGNHAAEEIDVTGWDTSNVTTMSACFSSWGVNPDGTDFIFKDNKLKRIKGLETWDTSKCELFGDAFSRNWNLEDIGDIGGWDMSSAWSVHHMFVEDLKLKTNVSGWRRTINPEVIGIGYCDVEKKTMCFNGYNEISGGHSSYASGVMY